MPKKGSRIPLAERFWAKVEITDSCWLWTGTTTQGYGYIGDENGHDGGTLHVHRVAYEMLVAPIPKGMEIDHLCHTADLSCRGGVTCLHRRCVNPAHLEPVTRIENGRRGRSPSSLCAKKTHCPKGHPYDEVNTKFSHNGRVRRCWICYREQYKRQWARHKVETNLKRIEKRRALKNGSQKEEKAHGG